MIEIDTDVVRKRGEPAVIAEEYDRTRAARALGESSGLFAVPRITRYDAAAGVLESERITDLTTLRQMAVRGETSLFQNLEQAGAALATIHAHLRQGHRTILQLPALLQPAEECVFLHGDFTAANVGVSASSGRLFIVDWSTAPMMGRQGNYGSRYFDLVWFTAFLFQVPSYRASFRWNSEGMAIAFLAEYAVHYPAFDPLAYARLGFALRPGMMSWWQRCERRHRKNWTYTRSLTAVIVRLLMARRWHLFLRRQAAQRSRKAPAPQRSRTSQQGRATDSIPADPRDLPGYGNSMSDSKLNVTVVTGRSSLPDSSRP
jgi:hypothetical protein